MVKRVLKRLFTPGDRLSQRVVHAGFWAFALRITDRLFGLARTIVLARVLSPNDFGLFGISLLALSALNTFSQTGFQAALVQKKGDIKPYLDTAWTVQVIRGLILAGILFGIAPYVASFFGEPMAAPLLRVLGLSAVFQGLTNIGVVYFQKELEFHKRFIYVFSGTLADLGVAIPAALILRNAWALVFGLLAGNFVRFVMSYIIYTYKPRVGMEWGKSKELFNYGRWILGSSILTFLLTQADDVFVGKMLGVTALGFYQMAYRLVSLPATEITSVISTVSFPVYSKLQRNSTQLRRAYSEALTLTSFLSIPLAGLILLLSKEIIVILLGVKWISVVPVVRVFAFAGLIRALGATISPVFQGIGKPKVITQMQLAILLLLIILIYPLTIKYGIVGTALASTGAALLPNLWFVRKLLSILNYRPQQFLKELLYPFIATIGMGLTILVFKFYVLRPETVVSLSFIILVGVTSYCLAIYCLSKTSSYRVLSILRSRLIGVTRRTL